MGGISGMDKADGLFYVKGGGKLLAVIIKPGYDGDGVNFFVPDSFPQQVGHMKYPKGHVIRPHIHGPVSRSIKGSQETLIIRKGKVRIDFYDDGKKYLSSVIVRRGDVVFLSGAAHGFEFMRDSKMIEVKQGPFLKKAVPERFEPVSVEMVRTIKE